MTRNVVEQIAAFNDGRDPERLKRKYERMRVGPFPFFRGTAHLYYADLPRHSKLSHAPLGWICGDLHLENFGVFKGANGVVHFDLNDFDEAALAPVTWDLARCAISIRLAAEEAGLGKSAAQHLVETYLESYRMALAGGKAQWVEAKTAQGAVAELLQQADKRKRVDLLDSRTRLAKGKRKIDLDGDHALSVAAGRFAAVTRFMKTFARKCGKEDFFKVIDVARRIAGTGSLGVERYVVLVEGKGSPDQNHLIDIKFALSSAAVRVLPAKLRRLQPSWVSEADRVVQVQTRVQAASPEWLTAVEFERRAYVLRELQPREDRLALDSLVRQSRFESALETMGQATAWSHLRSGGRQGSAIADELIEFAAKRHWLDRVDRYSAEYFDVVLSDWKCFCDAGLKVRKASRSA